MVEHWTSVYDALGFSFYFCFVLKLSGDDSSTIVVAVTKRIPFELGFGILGF